MKDTYILSTEAHVSGLDIGYTIFAPPGTLDNGQTPKYSKTHHVRFLAYQNRETLNISDDDILSLFPQSMGQVESFNRSLDEYVQNYITGNIDLPHMPYIPSPVIPVRTNGELSAVQITIDYGVHIDVKRYADALYHIMETYRHKPLIAFMDTAAYKALAPVLLARMDQIVDIGNGMRIEMRGKPSTWPIETYAKK